MRKHRVIKSIVIGDEESRSAFLASHFSDATSSSDVSAVPKVNVRLPGSSESGVLQVFSSKPDWTRNKPSYFNVEIVFFCYCYPQGSKGEALAAQWAKLRETVNNKASFVLVRVDEGQVVYTSDCLSSKDEWPAAALISKHMSDAGVLREAVIASATERNPQGPERSATDAVSARAAASGAGITAGAPKQTSAYFTFIGSNKGVGVSSFLERFTSGSFPERVEPTKKSTDRETRISAPKVGDVKLTLGDLSAQARVGMNNSYWRSGGAIVICYDASQKDSLTSAEGVIRAGSQVYPESKLLFLLGLQRDGSSVVTAEEVSKAMKPFPNVIGTFEVDAKTATQEEIAAIFQKMAQVVSFQKKNQGATLEACKREFNATASAPAKTEDPSDSKCLVM